MKCTECGAGLLLNQKYCKDCGSQVEIDNNKTKKCPRCSVKSIQTDNFCYGCGFSFKDLAKTIICEGRNKDGTKCNREMSTSDSFCSTCGTMLKKEDDLDGGNDQNQTDEKNKDQTEEINKDQTEEINKDQTEEINKVETEELDGREDGDWPKQETEKQINEVIEKTTEKPTSNEPSAEDDEPEKRGLAVVCSHSKFIHKTHKLQSRDSASDDHIMMKSLWKLYGCHVIDFEDEGSNFYDEKLIDKIKNALEKIENIEIFVFVLSSHGEEKEEKVLRKDEQGTFQHYFFTKDDQFSTQDLMNKIANIEKLDGKLKIFVIQACRSRTGAEDENKDYGVNLEIELEGSDLSGGENDGTVDPDAKGYTPDEDEKKDESDEKRKNDGIDQSDARGYMPPEDEDEDEEVMQQPIVASCRTEAQCEIENSSSGFIIDLPPVEGVPHCDDCVVMFASMAGKYAYSKSYSQHYSGGWLIKSVDKILKKYEKGDQPHILDILVEINREVGSRETEVKKDMGELPNLDLESEIKMEGLQPGLKNHIDKLSEIYGKHPKDEIKKCQDELNKLAAEIDQNGHTEDSLNSIKKKTVHLTKKFEQELQCVTLKAQSSFFHNLAFDLFLCKMK